MNFGDDLSISLLDVIEFERKRGTYKTIPRDFYALSIRINSSTTFSYKYGKVRLKEDDICLVPRHIGYTSSTAGEKMIVIHFTADNFETDKIQYHTPEFPKDFRKLFDEILAVWQDKNAGYKLRATSIFYQILSMIISSEANDSAPKNRYLSAGEYIKRNFSDPSLSIHNISENFNVCDALFRREFKKHFGVSPKKYLDNIRMEYAIHLLQTGYFTHDEIAERSGFTNAKYFRTAFKKKTGVPPSKYNVSDKI